MLRSFFIAIHWIHLSSPSSTVGANIEHNIQVLLTALAKGKMPSYDGLLPLVYIPDKLNSAVFSMQQWELKSIGVSDAFLHSWSGTHPQYNIFSLSPKGLLSTRLTTVLQQRIMLHCYLHFKLCIKNWWPVFFFTIFVFSIFLSSSRSLKIFSYYL